MTKKKTRVRLIFQRSRPLTKTVMLAAVVLSMAALITLNLCLQGVEKHTSDLREQAALLEQENRELLEKIRQLGTVQSVEDIAKNELGLVKPGSIIFNPAQP